MGFMGTARYLRTPGVAAQRSFFFVFSFKQDVATALGYSNPNEAITDHIFENDKLNSKMLSSFGQNCLK